MILDITLGENIDRKQRNDADERVEERRGCTVGCAMSDEAGSGCTAIAVLEDFVPSNVGGGSSSTTRRVPSSSSATTRRVINSMGAVNGRVTSSSATRKVSFNSMGVVDGR